MKEIKYEDIVMNVPIHNYLVSLLLYSHTTLSHTF